VLEALSSSESAALSDLRLDLYIKIWMRSSEPSFSGNWSRNLLSVMTRSASLHSVGQNRETSRYLEMDSRNAWVQLDEVGTMGAWMICDLAKLAVIVAACRPCARR